MQINKNIQKMHCCFSTAKLLGKHLYMRVYIYVNFRLAQNFTCTEPSGTCLLPQLGASVGSFESCCKIYGYLLYRAAEVVIIFNEFKSIPFWINTDYR